MRTLNRIVGVLIVVMLLSSCGRVPKFLQKMPTEEITETSTEAVDLTESKMREYELYLLDDYDNDGKKEAYGITGTWNDFDGSYTNVTVYFIDEDGNESTVITDLYGKYTGFVNANGFKFIVWEESAGGINSKSYVFGVRNGTWYEPQISRKYEYFRTENKMFVAEKADYNDGQHVWTTYKFEFNEQNGEFIEYKTDSDITASEIEPENFEVRDLVGTWYSDEDEVVCIFSSNGNDTCVTEKGLSVVDGLYKKIYLSSGDVERGGFEIEAGKLILHRPEKLEINAVLNENILILKDSAYGYVSEDFTNQLIGNWKNSKGYVLFTDTSYSKFKGTEKEKEAVYIVISENRLVEHFKGKYYVREYSVEGTKLMLSGEIFEKNGSDNSASVLSTTREKIIGSWHDKKGREEYVFFENRTFNRNIISKSVDGTIGNRTLVETGDYEVVDSSKIKLYTNGTKYVWTELFYNSKTDTLGYDQYSEAFHRAK